MALAWSVQREIEKRVAECGDLALLTREFAALAARSTGREALANVVADGNLVRLGHGVYCRAETDPVSGQKRLAGDFLLAAQQALTKLRVTWELSDWDRALQQGRLMEPPEQPALRVKSHCKRLLSCQGMSLRFER